MVLFLTRYVQYFLCSCNMGGPWIYGWRTLWNIEITLQYSSSVSAVQHVEFIRSHWGSRFTRSIFGCRWFKLYLQMPQLITWFVLHLRCRTELFVATCYVQWCECVCVCVCRVGFVDTTEWWSRCIQLCGHATQFTVGRTVGVRLKFRLDPCLKLLIGFTIWANVHGVWILLNW